MADEQADALRRLEQRLSEASEQAERLIEEVQDGPPAAGWQVPEDGGSATTLTGELEALISAVRSLRDLVPPEVVHRLAEALREVLLALRGLIDYYIERLERRAAEPPEVRDIPIT
jgi:hypothetical protein